MPHPHRPSREEAVSPLIDEPGHLPGEPDEGPAAIPPLVPPDPGVDLPVSDVPR